MWPKQPLQIQSFTSRCPLISIRPVLINLIWFRYQNIRRFGFVLSHMWRPLDCCTKTSFFIQFGNFLKTNMTFYHSFLLFKGKLLFTPRDVTMTDQHFWSAMFHLQLMGRSLDYLWSKTSGCCSLFSLLKPFVSDVWGMCEQERLSMLTQMVPSSYISLSFRQHLI